jgi:hypothetical protein
MAALEVLIMAAEALQKKIQTLILYLLQMLLNCLCLQEI